MIPENPTSMQLFAEIMDFSDYRPHILPERIYEISHYPFLNYVKILNLRLRYKKLVGKKEGKLPYEAEDLDDVSLLKFVPPTYTYVPWPVRFPRILPAISTPRWVFYTSRLDLSIEKHVLDWSSRAEFAMTFNGEVRVWNAAAMGDLAIETHTQRRIWNGIKWSPDGKELAVGSRSNIFGLWQRQEMRVTEEGTCLDEDCEILCFEWATDNFLMTGCSRGSLCLFELTDGVVRTKHVPAHDGSVIHILLSPDRTLVATCGVDKFVRLWTFQDLQVKREIATKRVTKAIDWHPFAENMLAIAWDQTISIWQDGYDEHAHRVLPKNAEIDCMKFNPRTGEIMITYYKRFAHNPAKNFGCLAVFTNFTNIVEEVRVSHETLKYALWGLRGIFIVVYGGERKAWVFNFFGPQMIPLNPMNPLTRRRYRDMLGIE